MAAGPNDIADDSKAMSDSKREMSTIQFPYGDLDDAISFAKAVHAVGGQSCLIEQLAGYLKVAPSGGAFRARLAHPRIFGFVEYEKGTVSLTQLGLRAVDSAQEASAKVEAFLTVPLYKAIYDKYKGYTLPPPTALENEMAGLGVSSKQTDKARQVFDRSAKQAGFFWAGSDRLTLPVLKARTDARLPDDSAPQATASAIAMSAPAAESSLHPFIQGLLKTLPPPETEWSAKDRKKWLDTAESIFGLIYKDSGQGDA